MAKKVERTTNGREIKAIVVPRLRAYSALQKPIRPASR